MNPAAGTQEDYRAVRKAFVICGAVEVVTHFCFALAVSRAPLAWVMAAVSSLWAMVPMLLLLFLLKPGSVKRAWFAAFLMMSLVGGFLPLLTMDFWVMPTVLWKYLFELAVWPGRLSLCFHLALSLWALKELRKKTVTDYWRQNGLTLDRFWKRPELGIGVGLALSVVSLVSMLNLLNGAAAQRALAEARPKAPAGAKFVVTNIHMNVQLDKGKTRVTARVLAYNDAGQVLPIPVEFEQ